MPRTIHGIDPTAPGGIEALMAFHRKTFGDAQMNANAGDNGESGGTGDNGVNTTEQGAPNGGQATPSTPPAEQNNTPAEWDGKIESLPPAAQKIITDLRKEAGDERVAKKQLDAIAKALNPEAGENEKPDASNLAKQLAEREAEAKQAQIELAVFKNAGAHGADASALLDSRAFLAKVADIDPTNSKAIADAIGEAVTNNPKLKAVLAAGSSTADGAGGSGEKAKRHLSLGEALAEHYGTK